MSSRQVLENLPIVFLLAGSAIHVLIYYPERPAGTVAKADFAKGRPSRDRDQLPKGR